MIRTAFERVLFASRFLLAPLYLALAISLVALLFKGGLHLYELLTQLPTLNDEAVLLSELGIV
ncbi:MAG: YqhA family protein, partial [Roseiarcus sp.]